ncbi:MAG: lipoprotein [Gammaproteobacteria bacterium]|nr:lipoprotein [Gammaproteobacteria bacterium]
MLTLKATFLILLCISALILSGCGQEGTLYLPNGKSDAPPIDNEKVRS